MPEIVVVAGARPNFVKVAPLLRRLRARPGVAARLVHTGQHYDDALSRGFFEDLRIPPPDVNLEVGSGTHGAQTAECLRRFEEFLLGSRPDAVVVVGDVNSTLAAALAAAKLGVRVAHVEAGLRSFDRTMPEELNRRLTDALADLLFVTEESGRRNLLLEGVAEERIHLVGNVMIDTLDEMRAAFARSDALERLGLRPRGFGVVTLHRPSNVDDRVTLDGVLEALSAIARDGLPLIWPVHPRTRARLEGRALPQGLRAVEPLGYLDFMRLLSEASLALTDSGGVQEEALVLGVPCVTLRENTERPVTIEMGGNALAGSDPARIQAAARKARSGGTGTIRRPPLWDGRAAERIVDVLVPEARV